jgi:hypothetical protein
VFNEKAAPAPAESLACCTPRGKPLGIPVKAQGSCC